MTNNFPLKLTFPVYSFRKIVTPLEEGDTAPVPRNYVAVVKVQDLPKNAFPMETNPRRQNLNSGVARKIAEGLLDVNFYFKNRGLLLSVGKVHFNNENQRCTLIFEDPEYHGLVDGGHTYAILQQAVEKKPDDGGLNFPQYIKLEILEGVERFFADLADARNTSTPVADKALDDLKDRFDWIQESLKDTPYGAKIAYKQFEEYQDDEKVIDVRELVSYLVCFKIGHFTGREHPIYAYTSKKKCLDIYREEAKKEEKENGGENSFRKLRPILKDILALRDHIYIRMPEIYKEGKEQKGKAGRFGKLRGVMSDVSTPLYFLPTQNGDPTVSRYTIPSAYIYPILAAFRSLVKENRDGTYGWKTDPFKFFDEEIGAPLVEVTIDFGTEIRNPNQVGKAKYHWALLYEKCEKKLEEVLSSTPEEALVEN